MARKKPTEGLDKRWKAVGARIVADRKAKKIGQAELGRMIGLQNPGSMWRYESGQVAIPIPRLEQIAEALGTPPSRYIPAETKPKRPPLSAEEQRELHGRLARAALDAAVLGTPEAIETLNQIIAEHHARTGR